MEDDPADEEDDFEVDLEAVDVVSFALVVVSLGCNSLVSDSITVATSLGNVVYGPANYLHTPLPFFINSKGGKCCVF